MIIAISILGGILLSVLIIWNDYIKRKKDADKIKVGDKRRIFTENEVTFDRVEIVELYENEKGKKMAKCLHEDGSIENLPTIDLIY